MNEFLTCVMDNRKSNVLYNATIFLVILALVTFPLCFFQVAFSYVIFSDPMKWKLTSACWRPFPSAKGSGWWNACAVNKSKPTMKERRLFRSRKESWKNWSMGRIRKFTLTLLTWCRMQLSTMMTKKVHDSQKKVFWYGFSRLFVSLLGCSFFFFWGDEG